MLMRRQQLALHSVSLPPPSLLTSIKDSSGIKRCIRSRRMSWMFQPSAQWDKSIHLLIKDFVWKSGMIRWTFASKPVFLQGNRKYQSKQCYRLTVWFFKFCATIFWTMPPAMSTQEMISCVYIYIVFILCHLLIKDFVWKSGMIRWTFASKPVFLQGNRKYQSKQCYRLTVWFFKFCPTIFRTIPPGTSTQEMMSCVYFHNSSDGCYQCSLNPKKYFNCGRFKSV